ncbi:Thiol:disulfide interchange protein [Ignavibacterium album JCM 16511]|uniref:Thiol:disulfide interchange protein n=1 Tax=Ignavibacterium album (strain DSM 19864 / JCM 16511 / NBRC 101810 / Mat9-16) TaxID=945713 RepID=I0AJQ1_IGNAJ|nr:cytochrome c biogenesis protein CcdA [Ignavibacterium album]AFH49208.1 Thiol:disulfide interchange protein [Ignavibacterium album JCM 16511]
MRKLLFNVFAVLMIISSNTFPQFGVNSELVKIKSYASFDKIYPGSEFKIAVKVKVAETWHINSDKPKEDFLIPTELTLKDISGFKILKKEYPEAKEYKFSFSETPLSVWEGEFLIGALIKVDENVQPGKYNLVLNLDYQACNNQSCMAPNSVSDTLVIEIADKSTPVNQINQEIFEKINIAENTQSVSQKEDDNSISSTLEKSGLLVGLLFVFIGGLALNLTPCVYPLIPITIGYFGGQSEGSTSRLTLMGVLFMLGMAVTYSIVGVITSLTGAVFGALLQNPVVIVIIAAIFVVLSLSMFGVYEFKLPDSWVAKAGGAKGGYYGAFFMGLTMGIVAAPCIGPFVLGLVTYVAAKGDPLFGFLMFFVLALGLGLPYLFLAIFSGKIKNLPRAGMWMDAVKHIFGFILLGMALYFLLPLLPKNISGYVLPVFGIIAAVYILFFDKAAKGIKGFTIFKTVFSILVIAISVWALIPSEKQSIDWQLYSDSALTSFEGKKGAIIDFYADWCIPCKELDAMTFSDAKVIEQSKNFITLKADMTKSLSPEVSALREKYKIVGVPTVLILNSKGEEVHRITGFVNAEEFLKIIQSVK